MLSQLTTVNYVFDLTKTMRDYFSEKYREGAKEKYVGRFLSRGNKYRDWFETFLELSELARLYQLFVATGARQFDLVQHSDKSHVVRYDCVSFEAVAMKNSTCRFWSFMKRMIEIKIIRVAKYKKYANGRDKGEAITRYLPITSLSCRFLIRSKLIFFS